VTASCIHTIALVDTYGDGWDTAMVDVLVNGIVVLDDITLPAGFGPLNYYFLAATGDTIDVQYTAGNWPTENEYYVYDGAGNQICAEGVGGVVPGDCTATGYCPYIDHIAADDWECRTDFPVSDVHWWGSFIGWDGGPADDPPMPDSFHIGIWTDAMCTDNVTGPFSCPEELIWENWCDNFTYEFVGWDWDPRDPLAPPEACYKFHQYLDVDDWYLQDGNDNNTFWLSIAAHYPDGEVVDHPWGWKTRPWSWQDDAVRIFDPTEPDLVSHNTFNAGEPIYWPDPLTSWDLAFQLTTVRCGTMPGDMNGDWKINGDDIQCFVNCLVQGFIATAPDCDCACADVDPAPSGDGYLKFEDAVEFVDMLLNAT
jgi:hypothetical protein